MDVYVCILQCEHYALAVWDICCYTDAFTSVKCVQSVQWIMAMFTWNFNATDYRCILSPEHACPCFIMSFNSFWQPNKNAIFFMLSLFSPQNSLLTKNKFMQKKIKQLNLHTVHAELLDKYPLACTHLNTQAKQPFLKEWKSLFYSKNAFLSFEEWCQFLREDVQSMP